MLTRQGQPIARSTVYNILNNPFYYGEFEWPKNSGNWYQGKHQPMTSKEEFDLIQKLLGKHGRPIPKAHQFNYTGLLRCSECGCAITATKKTKYYKGTKRTANYTYYHCTKKNPDIKCSQKPITKKDLEKLYVKQLKRLRPPKGFIDWAKKWLKVLHQHNSNTQESVLKSQQQTLAKVEKRLNNLVDMRLDGEIGQTTYKNKKIKLESEKKSLKEKLNDSDHQANQDRQTIENSLDFAHAAKQKFTTGTKDQKREVLFALGSNLKLNQKTLEVDFHPHLKVLSEQKKWSQLQVRWLEPQEYTDILTQYPDLQPENPAWLRR